MSKIAKTGAFLRMMRMRAKTNIRLALAAVLALCFSQAVPATTYYVNPGESIQDAIDSASYGDTVRVAAGVYIENITLKNGVAIIGAGESTTTIDGSASGSVVYSSNCDPNTVLDGFTITNGWGSDSPYNRAGGMYNYGNSPTVTNCTFSGNSAADRAGFFNALIESKPQVYIFKEYVKCSSLL